MCVVCVLINVSRQVPCVCVCVFLGKTWRRRGGTHDNTHIATTEGSGPDISMVITADDMVCVEAPASAAAPQRAKEATWQSKPGNARMKAWPSSRPRPAPTIQRQKKSPEGMGRLVSSTDGGMDGWVVEVYVCGNRQSRLPPSLHPHPHNTRQKHTHTRAKRTRGNEADHHHSRQQARLRVPRSIPGLLGPIGPAWWGRGQPRRGAEVQRLSVCGVCVCWRFVSGVGGLVGWFVVLMASTGTGGIPTPTPKHPIHHPPSTVHHRKKAPRCHAPPGR